MDGRSSWKVRHFVFTSKPFRFVNNIALCLSIGIYSEDAVPVDIADRLTASFPYYMSIGMGQRSAAKIAELDK